MPATRLPDNRGVQQDPEPARPPQEAIGPPLRVRRLDIGELPCVRCIHASVCGIRPAFERVSIPAPAHEALSVHVDVRCAFFRKRRGLGRKPRPGLLASGLTARQEEMVRALRVAGNRRAAAQALGCSSPNVEITMRKIAEKGLLPADLLPLVSPSTRAIARGEA